MFSQKIHNYIHFTILTLTLFFLPIDLKITTYLALGLLVNYIAELRFNKKFVNLFSSNKLIISLFFISVIYFLFYVLGSFISDNKQAAEFQLVQKLFFFLAPFALLNSISSRRELKTSKILLISYLSACLVSGLMMLITATAKYYISGGDTQYFFYTLFTQDFHPSYLSMYFVLALILAIYILIKQFKQFNNYKRFAMFLLIVFYLIIIGLAQSRAGILISLFVVFSYLIYIVFRLKKWKLGVASFALLFAIGLTGILVFPQTLDRFDSAFRVLKIRDVEEYKEWDGTALRVEVYIASVEVIKENFWFGTSSGDLEDELIKKYDEYGFRSVSARHYNTHNQFLETFASLGIFGFITLLLFLLIPLIYGFKNHNFPLVLLSISIIFFFMFESMLQRQQALMFVPVVLMVLMNYFPTRNVEN